MICIKPLYSLSALTFILGLAVIAPAQANHQPLVTQKVNAALVTPDGNTRPETTAANLGLVDDSMSLNARQIVMQRSPENEEVFTGIATSDSTPLSSSRRTPRVILNSTPSVSLQFRSLAPSCCLAQVLRLWLV
jgi:hypothetical protein